MCWTRPGSADSQAAAGSAYSSPQAAASSALPWGRLGMLPCLLCSAKLGTTETLSPKLELLQQYKERAGRFCTLLPAHRRVCGMRASSSINHYSQLYSSPSPSKELTVENQGRNLKRSFWLQGIRSIFSQLFLSEGWVLHSLSTCPRGSGFTVLSMELPPSPTQQRAPL